MLKEEVEFIYSVLMLIDLISYHVTFSWIKQEMASVFLPLLSYHSSGNTKNSVRKRYTYFQKSSIFCYICPNINKVITYVYACGSVSANMRCSDLPSVLKHTV